MSDTDEVTFSEQPSTVPWAEKEFVFTARDAGAVAVLRQWSGREYKLSYQQYLDPAQEFQIEVPKSFNPLDARHSVREATAKQMAKNLVEDFEVDRDTRIDVALIERWLDTDKAISAGQGQQTDLDQIEDQLHARGLIDGVPERQDMLDIYDIVTPGRRMTQGRREDYSAGDYVYWSSDSQEHVLARVDRIEGDRVLISNPFGGEGIWGPPRWADRAEVRPQLRTAQRQGYEEGDWVHLVEQVGPSLGDKTEYQLLEGMSYEVNGLTVDADGRSVALLDMYVDGRFRTVEQPLDLISAPVTSTYPERAAALAQNNSPDRGEPDIAPNGSPDIAVEQEQGEADWLRPGNAVWHVEDPIDHEIWTVADVRGDRVQLRDLWEHDRTIWTDREYVNEVLDFEAIGGPAGVENVTVFHGPDEYEVLDDYRRGPDGRPWVELRSPNDGSRHTVPLGKLLASPEYELVAAPELEDEYDRLESGDYEPPPLEISPDATGPDRSNFADLASEISAREAEGMTIPQLTGRRQELREAGMRGRFDRQDLGAVESELTERGRQITDRYVRANDRLISRDEGRSIGLDL